MNKPSRLSNVLAACVIALGCVSSVAAFASGDVSDGSRTRAVHNLRLYDELGQKIDPNAAFPLPFSTSQTCGICHDYKAIASGWHFNAADKSVNPGRPGEPWVVVDEKSGVALPVSERAWPGVYTPQQAGLTPWSFSKRFARHFPGGGMGEMGDTDSDSSARWEISGPLEVNCLTCHNAASEQNQSEYAIQSSRENFRWANTSSSGLGVVSGVASRVPDGHDVFEGPNPDNTYATPPEVTYNKARFDSKKRVCLDVRREGAENRCFFCHSSAQVGEGMPDELDVDQDVHLAAGLTCTDCHRNELNHDIVRGYDGDEAEGAAALSCKGCHVGTADGTFSTGGRLKAPRPSHIGIPAIHLEKLTCTACHSGPMPALEPASMRTARANRLGIHGQAQWDTASPDIKAPVFMRQADGVIAPHYMMWPAFWGRSDGAKVTPLPVEAVATIVADVRKETPAPAPAQQGSAENDAPAAAPAAEAAPAAPAADAAAAAPEGESTAPPEAQAAPAPVDEYAPLTSEQVAKVLAKIAETEGEGTPVYVAGGLVHKLTGNGQLASEKSDAAKPYSWAMGHDVRPASQALGAKGCTDCHSDKSGFLYGNVTPSSPAATPTAPAVRMYELAGVEHEAVEALEAVALLRNPLLACAALLGALLAFALAYYGFAGVEGVLRMLVPTGGKEGR